MVPGIYRQNGMKGSRFFRLATPKLWNRFSKSSAQLRLQEHQAMTKPKEPYQARCIDCGRPFHWVHGRGRIALRCETHYQEHLTEYNRLAKRRQRLGKESTP